MWLIQTRGRDDNPIHVAMLTKRMQDEIQIGSDSSTRPPRRLCMGKTSLMQELGWHFDARNRCWLQYNCLRTHVKRNTSRGPLPPLCAKPTIRLRIAVLFYCGSRWRFSRVTLYLLFVFSAGVVCFFLFLVVGSPLCCLRLSFACVRGAAYVYVALVQ